MGLDILVGEECYYDHSYSAIHLLREFAETKGKNRFIRLINHPDNEGGYLPIGIQSPDKSLDKFQWQSVEALLNELNILWSYSSEMTEQEKRVHMDLTKSAQESILKRLPMIFS